MLVLCYLIVGDLSAQNQESNNPEQVDFFLAKHSDIERCVIREIKIVGNDQTKPFIIHRQMNIDKGDTLLLANLEETLKSNREQIRNTQLFTSADIKPFWLNKEDAKLLIQVSERWYSFPKPIFELADRNFNEWWVERDHDLSRTVFGIKFYQENLSGRNDPLEIGLELGFRENYSLFYTLPFLTKTSSTGLRAGASFSRSKKPASRIENNNLVFEEGNDYLQRDFMSELTFTHREKVRVEHELSSTFHSQWIADTIQAVNEGYFEQKGQVQRFFKLSYAYERDFRDRINYAEKGYYLKAKVEKLGLGVFNDVNHTRAEFTFQKFWPLGRDFYLASEVQGLVSLKGNQSFSIARGLGYEDILVRGYEYDVINGQQYGLNRNSLRYKLFDTKFRQLSFIPIEQFSTIPLAMYLKVFADQGYVVDNYEKPVNQLANQYLTSTGLGFDLVTYYDVVFRVEYAFNNQGENGLFLHFVKPF